MKKAEIVQCKNDALNKWNDIQATIQAAIYCLSQCCGYCIINNLMCEQCIMFQQGICEKGGGKKFVVWECLSFLRAAEKRAMQIASVIEEDIKNTKRTKKVKHENKVR